VQSVEDQTGFLGSWFSLQRQRFLGIGFCTGSEPGMIRIVKKFAGISYFSAGIGCYYWMYLGF
jgi:hypothetical protein